jgi:hypothetical protein
MVLNRKKPHMLTLILMAKTQKSICITRFNAYWTSLNQRGLKHVSKIYKIPWKYKPLYDFRLRYLINIHIQSFKKN